MKINKKIFTYLLIIIILFVLFGCTSNNNKDSNNIFNEGTTYEAKVNNGIQEVKLSWGKFNYNPSKIIVKKDLPVKIIADTDRLQGCYSSLIIKDFGVSKLFSNKDNIVQFTPTKTGEFHFSCSMGMGSGTLVVK